MKKDLYNDKLFNIRNLKREGGRIGRKAQMLLLAGIIIAATIATMGIVVSSISGAKVTAILEKPNPIFLEYRSLRYSFDWLLVENCRKTDGSTESIRKVFNYTLSSLSNIEQRYGRYVEARILSINDYGREVYINYDLTLSASDGRVSETVSLLVYIRG